MKKFIGMFLGFKLFADKEMTDDALDLMIGKLNKPGECLTLPVGCSYHPFKKAWSGLSNEQKIILIRNAPNWTVLQLIEEVEVMLEMKNA